MHETMIRLYQAADELAGLIGQSDVARYLGQSPQTLNNWERRGMSKGGMLIAQRRFGCSAVWLETGQGDMCDLAPADEHQDLITAWEDLLPKERLALLEEINQKAEHNREARAQPVSEFTKRTFQGGHTTATAVIGGPPSKRPKTLLRRKIK